MFGQGSFLGLYLYQLRHPLFFREKQALPLHSITGHPAIIMFPEHEAELMGNIALGANKYHIRV